MEQMLTNFPTNESLKRLRDPEENQEWPSFSVLQNSYAFSKTDHVAETEEEEGSTRKKRLVAARKDDHLREAAERLAACVDLVLNETTLQESYNECYNLVEQSCKAGKVSELHEMLRVKLTNYFNDKMLPIILEDTSINKNYTHKFVSYWKQWDYRLSQLKLIFLYLEKGHLVHSKSKKSILQLGLELYADHFVVLNPELSTTRLYQLGELPMRLKIFDDFADNFRKFVVTKDENLGVELQEFVEIIFELDTCQGRKIKFIALLDDLIPRMVDNPMCNWVYRDGEINNEFLIGCIFQWDTIHQLLTPYSKAGKSNEKHLRQKFANSLIPPNMELIFKYLLPQILFKDTSQVEYLFHSLVEAGQDPEVFEKAYTRDLDAEVQQIFQARYQPEYLVIDALITLKKDIYQRQKIIFRGFDETEMKARLLFTRSINNHKFLKLLNDQANKYIDVHVKNNDKEKLLEFEELFPLIQDKKLFKSGYLLRLSRRLLSDKTDPSLDQLVVGIMERAGGEELVSSLKVMIQNILDSRLEKVGSELPFEFELLTLDTRAWAPLRKIQDVVKNTVEFKLPLELENILSHYQDSWEKRENVLGNKKLEWVHHLSQVTLESSRFSKWTTKSLTIVVNLLQCCILLLVDEHECLSYEELKILLQISNDQVLTNHLDSLAMGKRKLLLKSNNANEFRINENFKTSSNRVKMTLTSSNNHGNNENAEPLYGKRVLPSVEYDDKMRALILRIMKSVGEIEHLSLVQRLFLASTEKFVVSDLQSIKRAIESLISGEMIKRVKTGFANDEDGYLYIP